MLQARRPASFDVIRDVTSHVVNTFSAPVKFIDRHFTDFRDKYWFKSLGRLSYIYM